MWVIPLKLLNGCFRAGNERFLPRRLSTSDGNPGAGLHVISYFGLMSSFFFYGFQTDINAYEKINTKGGSVYINFHQRPGSQRIQEEMRSTGCDEI